MSQKSNRLWSNGIDISYAFDFVVEALKKARDKKILTERPPSVYYCYIIQQNLSVNHFMDITSIFKYSLKDTPENDYMRDNVLRLLSVALKAHYFNDKDVLVKHEPYVFTCPDLNNIGNNNYGLIYNLNNNKTIIVSDKKLLDKKTDDVIYFPVVLTSNSFHWLNRKYWNTLLEERENAIQLAKSIDIKDVSDEKNFLFGEIVFVPYVLKNEMLDIGFKWSDKMKKFFIKLGWDKTAMKEYLSYKTSVLKNKK